MEKISTILFEKKKVVISLGIIIALFFSIVFGLVMVGCSSSKMSQEDLDRINSNEAQYEQQVDALYSDYREDGTIDNKDIELSPIDNGGIEDIDVDFVKKISWEVPQSISSDAQYTKFLQIAGKNIKLNLQNDLILAREVPKGKIVKIDIQISPKTSIVGLKMVKGSGMESVDVAIQNVIVETLSYMKPPKPDKDLSDLTLVIEL